MSETPTNNAPRDESNRELMARIAELEQRCAAESAERARLQQALRESEELYRLLVAFSQEFTYWRGRTGAQVSRRQPRTHGLQRGFTAGLARKNSFIGRPRPCGATAVGIAAISRQLQLRIVTHRTDADSPLPADPRRGNSSALPPSRHHGGRPCRSWNARGSCSPAVRWLSSAGRPARAGRANTFRPTCRACSGAAPRSF